jgi:hypothetical protein
MSTIDTAVSWALSIAADDTHGYDQANRWGPDYDCSSLVITAWEKAGVPVRTQGGSTYTGNMYRGFTACGFLDVSKNINLSNGDGLKKGDVLLNTADHTAMYIGGGKLVQASINEFGGVTGGNPGDQTGKEIWTRSYYNYPWNYVLRYPGASSESYCSNIAVVAAICGCFWVESNVNPGIWESLKPTSWDHQYAFDGIGGYGLGQWTNYGTPHGRCYNLHNWVTSHGYADGDGNGQLAFLIAENYWTSGNYSGAYPTLTAFLKSTSTDINGLTAQWLACWEGVPGNALYARQMHALDICNYLKSHKDDDVTWVSSNTFLAESQILNNSVCVWKWLSGNSGGSGSTTDNGISIVRFIPA